MRAWSKIRKFWRRDTGNVALFFALILGPMMMVIGLSVDGQRATAAKAKLQHATDAAVLVAAKEYYAQRSLTEKERKKAARQAANRIFKQNHKALGLKAKKPTIKYTFSTINGTVDARATSLMANAFGSLLGRDTTLLGAKAQAAVGGNKKVEIALILDNSTSMFNSNRMNLMRSAAVDFTNRLFDNYGHEDVKISVVPWATTVNIMTEPIGAPNSDPAGTAFATADGSRTVPKSPAKHPWRHTQNPFTGQDITRKRDANNMFAPTKWRGCIRGAKGEREVDFSGSVKTALTDAFPTSDWPLAIVPPKLEPVSYQYNQYCGNGCWTTNTSALRPDPWFSWGSSNNYQPKSVPVGIRPDQNRNSQLQAYRNAGWTDSNDKIIPCLADPNEVKYLNDGGKVCTYAPSNKAFNYSSYVPSILPWTSQKAINGPNMNCPTPMLPASANRKQVIDKLNQMHPAPGGTHADVGLMWGLRTLSPREDWTNFFSYRTDEKPADWTDPEIVKIGILLTDGLNVAPGSYEGYYGCTGRSASGYDVGQPEDFDESVGCWRHPDVKRLDKGALDNLMLDACKQMKEAYGMRLYTIAVDINDTNAIGKLKQCASSDDDFFNITSSDIGIAFDALLTTVIRISQ